LICSAKYPLATFSKIISIHGGNILIGYDIGCHHSVTARNHPLTSELVRKNKTEYIVGAFHGYAHERSCQLMWHPLWRIGAGMEDFEGCERFFSHSNAVAHSTQHASKYNRRQQIHQHIEGSNMERLANMGKLNANNDYLNLTTKLHTSGRFLLNKFRSAVSQLEESLSRRNQAMVTFGIQENEFASFVDAEKEYLNSLSSEPAEDTNAVDYITTLERITDLQ
jgi:hypothetical protein